MNRAFTAKRRTKEFEDNGSGDVQQLHDRTGDADEDVHGASHRQSDPFRTLESEGFGDEFAEEDFKVRDQGERHDHGDRVGVEDRVSGKPVQPATRDIEDRFGDRWFTDPAKGEAGNGDAELYGGEELIDG